MTYEELKHERHLEYERWKIRLKSDAIKHKKFFENNGYKLIAYTVMMLEDTFVLESSELATEASNKFEWNETGIPKLEGWWYGQEEFDETIRDYTRDFDVPDIIWFNKGEVKLTKEELQHYKQVSIEYYSIQKRIRMHILNDI
jgi:hypothetical protein